MKDTDGKAEEVFQRSEQPSSEIKSDQDAEDLPTDRQTEIPTTEGSSLLREETVDDEIEDIQEAQPQEAKPLEVFYTVSSL